MGIFSNSKLLTKLPVPIVLIIEKPEKLCESLPKPFIVQFLSPEDQGIQFHDVIAAQNVPRWMPWGSIPKNDKLYLYQAAVVYFFSSTCSTDHSSYT